jgi:hypothetical protein
MEETTADKYWGEKNRKKINNKGKQKAVPNGIAARDREDLRE